MTVDHPRYAVIPTNGRESVLDTVNSVYHQVDVIIIVEAGFSVIHHDYPEKVVVLRDAGPDLNISRWWNMGLDWAAEDAAMAQAAQWDVAILNDDVTLQTAWVCYIADQMRGDGCVAGCSGGPDGLPIIHRTAGPVNAHHRLQGYAFILAGESGIRANEEMRWYFSDDWIDFTARQAGGMVMYPHCQVNHRTPNGQMTGELHAAVAEDAQKFKNHWGLMPW